MSAIEEFGRIASHPKFAGWPMVGEVEFGDKIKFFGQPITYNLETGNGVESYTSILRHFGWAVVFGVKADKVLTLVQWKPGVNRASWELPPGGIGKISPDMSMEEIVAKTREVYLRETGCTGNFEYLGHIDIETGKYRGAGVDDHGLKAHLSLARDLVEVQGARSPNPNEIMETLWVPIREFPAVLASGLFSEESAVVCAYRALERLGFLKWNL